MSIPSRARVEGVDVARGLAAAIMIQGHAYDGWVLEAEKASAAYRLTRVLGTLPLPSFFLLAGAAVALRVSAAVERGEPARDVRRALVRRGLFVLVAGYAVDVASAFIDGFEGAETFFRVDVLHAIGLSIVLLGGLGIRGDRAGRVDARALVLAASLLAVVPLTVVVPIARALWTTPPPLAFLVGLVSFVPGITRMPLVPLAAWAGAGVLTSLAMIRANRTARSIGGAPDRVLIGTGVAALLVIAVFTRLTGEAVSALGGPLDQRHLGVVPNAIELTGRGLFVLALGGLLTPRLPASVRAVLGRLGQGSLVAYVVHVPFCYGALGTLVRGRLTMLEATLGVVLLEIVSYAAVVARDLVALRLAQARVRRREAAS